MSHTGISVVIPNYNGIDLLPKILPPLFEALAFTGLPNEVIISDDLSKDDSVAFLQKNFPQVKLLLNMENQGFSPTINKGIFAAQYDLVLLLNSDVIVSKDYLTPQLRYFEREDTFGVMGRIVGWGDDLLQDTAKFPSFHGAKIKTTGNYFSETPQKNDWLYSMYLSGANALVDRKKLVQLNGFDEIFAPFYVEDYELSLRAWRLGWKCYYEHFAVCRHKVSVSIKSKSKKSFINKIYYRNKMFLHAMHLSGARKFFWYAQLIPETLIRIFTGRFYYLSSLRLFFENRERMEKSRKQFLHIAKKEKQLLSVPDVVERIQLSLQEKNIKKF